MKLNLPKISKRAQSFLINPAAFKTDIRGDFEVLLDKSDRILTVFHSKKAENLDFILAEVLIKFAKNKNIHELWKISFREIESFLRDENHLHAFQEDSLILDKLWRDTLCALIASCAQELLKEDIEELINQAHQWKKQTLVAKNLWAQKLISPMGWQLVFCDTDQLSLKGLPEKLNSDELQALFSKILGEGESVLPVKVVAVQ